MAEIKTKPFKITNAAGDEYFAFGPEHTLADIVRWLMENSFDAEEVRRMLEKELYD